MAKKRLKSLRKTLLQRGLLSASLPILILGFFSILVSGYTLYRAINNRNQTIVRQGALQVEKHIATLERDIRLLSSEIEEGAEHELHLTRFMKSHPEYSMAWITDSTGKVIFAAPSEYNLVGLDKSRSEPFIASSVNRNSPHFSNTTISYELQEPVVTISFPLHSGIIALEYRTGELNRYMANVANNQGFYLVLSDKTGTWITHPDSTKVQQRDRDPNGNYLKNLKENQRDSLWLRFEGRLASYFVQENKQAGWIITIYQPLSVIFSPLTILMIILFIIGAVMVIFSLIQNQSTVHKTVQPIEHFVALATEVSNGEYELNLPDVEFSELQTLTSALQTMVRSIQEREIKQRELWEQLIQSQKMEVVGALAGGIAHDFNNILTAIGGFAQLLTADLPEGSKEQGFAIEINNSVTRASALTRQLLTFSRKEDVDIIEVEVVSCIDSMMSMLHRIVGEDISLCFNSVVSEAYIRADHLHVEQVLLNLTVNAADALREYNSKSPRIQITVTSQNSSVEITVADNGPGIPETVKEHIFEPFFTTKGQGKGTGMGLSTVRGIIQQHGADISIDTSEKGTTFTTRWPLCAKSKPRELISLEKDNHNSLTILFVDDEPMLRNIGEAMLSRLGHDVTIAKDAREAINKLENRAGGFDLLLTDLIMPGGMSGDELALEVSHRWPAIKILFLSGYTDNHLENVGVTPDKIHFLQKPFRIEQLKEAIEKRYYDSEG